MNNHFIHSLKSRLEGYSVNLKEIRRLEATKALAKIKGAVRAKTDGLCFYCGEAGEITDHFIPIAKGGSDLLDNLFPCCRACNNSKGDHLLEDWRVSRRMKAAREEFDLPSFSVSQCNWMQERLSINILEQLGVPHVDFWFERMGIETPTGSTIQWEPSEASLEWARFRIARDRKMELADFCGEYDARQSSVVSKLKQLGISNDVLRDLRVSA